MIDLCIIKDKRNQNNFGSYQVRMEVKYNKLSCWTCSQFFAVVLSLLKITNWLATETSK